MNLVAYGIADVNSLFQNILLIRLKTGESIISYTNHNSDGSVVMFLPMELVRQPDDSFLLRAFLPFVKERIFYVGLDDLQLIKGTVLQYITDQYRKITETLYKNDIEEILFSAQSFKTVEDEIELSSGVAIH